MRRDGADVTACDGEAGPEGKCAGGLPSGSLGISVSRVSLSLSLSSFLCYYCCV